MDVLALVVGSALVAAAPASGAEADQCGSGAAGGRNGAGGAVSAVRASRTYTALGSTVATRDVASGWVWAATDRQVSVWAAGYLGAGHPAAPRAGGPPVGANAVGGANASAAPPSPPAHPAATVQGCRRYNDRKAAQPALPASAQEAGQAEAEAAGVAVAAELR